MSDDRNMIAAFASVSKPSPQLREAAIDAYRRLLRAGEDRRSLEMQYMSEVDNPMPDLALRSRYRVALLKSYGIE